MARLEFTMFVEAEKNCNIINSFKFSVFGFQLGVGEGVSVFNRKGRKVKLTLFLE
jgi:hypothetical protein